MLTQRPVSAIPFTAGRVPNEEPVLEGAASGFGYNALNLGTSVHGGNLEIIRKLGWGRHSSVWLAKAHTGRRKYVAVKILTANITTGVITDRVFEVKVLQALNGSRSFNPAGSRYCLELYDFFLENSVHGPHVCFTTEVLGGNLIDLRQALNQPRHSLPVDVVKKITKQTLHALDFVNGTCKVVHTDVKSENILVYLPDVDRAVEDALVSDPTEKIYSQKGSFPSTMFTVESKPLRLPRSTIGLSKTLEIRLVDFGSAQFVNNRIDGLEVQAIEFRAPEIILGYSTWGTAIDIWSLGCTIFENLTGTSLFGQSTSDSLADKKRHLEKMVDITGQGFSPTFVPLCKNKDSFRDATNRQPSQPSLPNCLRAAGTMSEGDIIPASDFIRKCLDLNPLSRPTAGSLLSHSWLAGV